MEITASDQKAYEEAYFLQILEETRVDSIFEEPVDPPAETAVSTPQIPCTPIDQQKTNNRKKVAVVPEHFYVFETEYGTLFYCVVGLCKEFFADKNSLARHMVTHSKKDDVFCPYQSCVGVKFTAQKNLLNHIFRHLDYRPYICIECKKGFVGQGDLNTHRTKKHQQDALAE